MNYIIIVSHPYLGSNRVPMDWCKHEAVTKRRLDKSSWPWLRCMLPNKGKLMAQLGRRSKGKKLLEKSFWPKVSVIHFIILNSVFIKLKRMIIDQLSLIYSDEQVYFDVMICRLYDVTVIHFLRGMQHLRFRWFQ